MKQATRKMGLAMVLLILVALPASGQNVKPRPAKKAAPVNSTEAERQAEITRVIVGFNEVFATAENGDDSKTIAQIRKERTTRRPASAGSDESINKISQALWKCKSSEDFAGFLNDLEKGYKDYSIPAKVLTLHLLPIRAFRGIAWRSKELFEKNSAFIQSQVVSRIRSMVASLRVQLPVEHMDALVDYLVAPYESPDGIGKRSFASESDLQFHLIVHFGRELRDSISKLNQVKIASPFEWDNKVLYGPKSFPDGTGRFSYYGELERNASLATFYAIAHNLSILAAYHVDGSLRLAKNLGHLYGFDGFKNVMNFSRFSQVDGVSRIQVADTIRRSSPKRFATLIGASEKGSTKSCDSAMDGCQRMYTAYLAAVNANSKFQTLWKATKDLTSKDDELLQAGFFNIRRTQKERVVNILNDLYSVKWNADKKIIARGHPIAIRSLVTGEVVKVDVDALYLSPPTDLRVFLPTKGQPETKRIAAGVQYRDYYEGTPTKWRVSDYQKYFPSVADDDGVKRLNRVLADIGGLWVMAGN